MTAFGESTVLVLDDKEVLGFVALYSNQLRAVFVRRDVRGKGMGQALLDAARSQTGREMILNVAKPNIRAQRFCTRNGFRAVGEVARMYRSTEIKYIQMRSSYASPEC
ncbi:GNAT family N-acetyltransferase [Pseudoduganella lutea]|uniref:GNAT family N-acetyltransferase n=1 Tax=Pseudoduganella lutea TaxID=321985 RepID=A0A4P6L750_9BURK|nr:GNAT family N-acetyltransferase [Pseudoduganella lutea]